MHRHTNGWFRYITGGLLILVGVGFLLQKLGLITGSMWSYWPVVLIIIGIAILVDKK